MTNREQVNITRAHLADAICRATGLSRTDASDFVEIFLELISETLLREESVMFSGFGKFQVVKRAARKGRNVKLGVDVMIEPRLAIVFKPAPNLVSRLNETTDDAQKHATAAA